MISGCKAAFATALLTLVIAHPALAADKLYGITNDGKIITVNPNWGATAFVYDTHAPSLGLAFNPNNDSLYSLDGSSRLLVYDIVERTQRIISFTGNLCCAVGLAFNADFSELYSLDQATRELVSYNLNDLTISDIASYSDGLPGTRFSSIATELSGDMFVGGDGGGIYKLDPRTGQSALQAGLPFSGFSPLAVDGTGDLFGIDRTSGISRLYSGLLTQFSVRGGIDPAFFVSGLAFSSLESAPIPEPSVWSMMMLGFGGLGVVLRRRRQVLALPARELSAA